MSEPLVSIIILNINKKEGVERLVASIRKSTYKNFEIALADNASTDGSEFLGKKLGIKVMHFDKNIGTAAWNPPLKITKGEFVLIMGNDMTIDKNAIKKLVDFMITHPKAALAMSKMTFSDNPEKIDRAGNWMSRSFYGGVIKSDVLGDKPAKIPYGIGLIRRSAIEQFGYIVDPEYFLYAEDLDMGVRFWISGWECWHVPDSLIYHMGSVTSTRMFTDVQLAYWNERNMLRTYLTTLSPPNLLLYAPYVYGMRLIAIIRDLLILKFKRAAVRVGAVLWPLFNLKIILKKRKLVQKNRRSSDSVLFSVCSEKFLFSSGK
jgi:hypothetical protein